VCCVVFCVCYVCCVCCVCCVVCVVSHPYKTTGKIIVLYSVLMFLIIVQN
jgi:hypothetical protein